MSAEIMTARVLTGSGVLAATIDRVDVGGGEQVVTVDGVPEVRVHPISAVYHVRLIAPNRMVPDELLAEATYEAAVEAAEEYAARLAVNAERIAELAEDLRA